MPISCIINELYRGESEDNSRAEFRYLVEGVATIEEALVATREATGRFHPPLANYHDPNRNRYLKRTRISATEVHKADTGIDPRQRTAVFQTTVTYESRYVCPLRLNDYGISQDKVTQSYETYGKYPRVATAVMDFGGLIEYDTSKGSPAINGADAIMPSHKFNLVWHPPNWMELVEDKLYHDMNAYRDWVGKLIGVQNSATFLGRPPGDVVLTGFIDRLIDQRQEYWEFTFSFEERVNNDGKIIDGITVAKNPGFAHLWGPKTLELFTVTGGGSGKFTRPQFKQINTERVQKQCDLNNLFYTYPAVTSPEGPAKRYLLVKSCYGFVDQPDSQNGDPVEPW